MGVVILDLVPISMFLGRLKGVSGEGGRAEGGREDSAKLRELE